jgi:hypothetical protein
MRIRKRERGYISPFPGSALKAITLWRIGPFRRVLYRDIDGKCRKRGPAWVHWIPREPRT